MLPDVDEIHRRFDVEACLGRGGFGEVYRARCRLPSGIERTVALKMLRAREADPDALARLRDEARSLALLDHPNILRVDDLVLLAGHTAVVAEFVDGADWSRFAGRAPVWVHLGIAAQVADALDNAWNAVGPAGPLRLVHRDVKPSNVRLGRNGAVKLLDFGVAHYASPQREARTSSDKIVGSLAYVAPERFHTTDITGAADVFSLCNTLLQVLTGQPFHIRPTPHSVASLAGDPGDWDSLVTDRIAIVDDEDLRQILCVGLAWEPTRRPTAAALAARLDAASRRLAEGKRLRDWLRQLPSDTTQVDGGRFVGHSLVDEGSVPVRRAASVPMQAAPARPAAGAGNLVEVGFGCALAVTTAASLCFAALLLQWLGG